MYEIVKWKICVYIYIYIYYIILYMYIQIENVLENNYLEVFTNTYSCACMKGFVHFVQQIYVYKSI